MKDRVKKWLFGRKVKRLLKELRRMAKDKYYLYIDNNSEHSKLVMEKTEWSYSYAYGHSTLITLPITSEEFFWQDTVREYQGYIPEEDLKLYMKLCDDKRREYILRLISGMREERTRKIIRY